MSKGSCRFLPSEACYLQHRGAWMWSAGCLVADLLSLPSRKKPNLKEPSCLVNCRSLLQGALVSHFPVGDLALVGFLDAIRRYPAVQIQTTLRRSKILLAKSAPLHNRMSRTDMTLHLAPGKPLARCDATRNDPCFSHMLYTLTQRFNA